MARFMRAIHALLCASRKKDVDGPDKPGHDGILFVPVKHLSKLIA
jgi:hypothetical protein